MSSLNKSVGVRSVNSFITHNTNLFDPLYSFFFLFVSEKKANNFTFCLWFDNQVGVKFVKNFQNFLFPGPFRHVIAFVKYDTVLGMLVCYESTHHQGYKFVMIWSRERSLPLPILKELRSKMGAYINQGRIRMVDHGDC